MNKKGTPQNLTPFKKGSPGGPGRPKKLPELDILLVEELGEEKNNITKAQAIIKKVTAMALAGDLRAAEVILDRAYGKTSQKIALSGSIETRTIQYAPQSGNEPVKD